MKKNHFLFSLISLFFILTGCSQPDILTEIKETDKEATRELVFKKEVNRDMLYQLEPEEIELLEEASKNNTLKEEEMVEIARDLMVKEVSGYTLPDKKESFNEWINSVFMNPEEYEFLRHYNELGNYSEIDISFDYKEGTHEHVEKLGETGFIYRNIMEIKGVNKETENKEYAILNFILYIDKNPEGQYRIVKMGGATASDIIEFGDHKLNKFK